MPKPQKKARSSASRANPLPSRNANASKQPPASKKPSKSKKTAENDSGSIGSPSWCSTNSHESATAESDPGNNYLVLAVLSRSENPTINRLLSLPPSLTFEKLHHVLQIAFGWTNSHMHDFTVSLIDENDDHDAEPRFCLSIGPNPDDLSDDSGVDSKAESEITLADVYEKPEWKDKTEIDYEYDHGDSWKHQLILLGRATPGTNAQFGAPRDVTILCLWGEGHPAAEDVGGICGWEDLKDAFKRPRKAESRELIEWYKGTCLNGNKKLDPYEFDAMDVNDGFQDAFVECQSKGKGR